MRSRQRRDPPDEVQNAKNALKQEMNAPVRESKFYTDAMGVTRKYAGSEGKVVLLYDWDSDAQEFELAEEIHVWEGSLRPSTKNAHDLCLTVVLRDPFIDYADLASRIRPKLREAMAKLSF